MEAGILYSVISRGADVLSRYAACVGNFNEVTSLVLERISSTTEFDEQNGGGREENEDFKKSLIHDSYVYHYIASPNGVIYLCVTEVSLERKEAFTFLERIKNKFSTQFPGSSLKSALPYAINAEFALVLAAEMKKINQKIKDGSNGDKITRLRDEVDQVRDIMVSNIDSLVERGEKLDLLVDKTENLSSQSVTFKQTSRNLSRKMWWQNARWTIFFGFVVLLVIYLILAAACGGTSLPKCL